MSNKITINGITLEKGMSLFRFKNLFINKIIIGEQDPDGILRDIAEHLAIGHPNEVDNKSVDELFENLSKDSMYYNDTQFVHYTEMIVKYVTEYDGERQVIITDFKEGKNYVLLKTRRKKVKSH